MVVGCGRGSCGEVVISIVGSVGRPSVRCPGASVGCPGASVGCPGVSVGPDSCAGCPDSCVGCPDSNIGRPESSVSFIADMIGLAVVAGWEGRMGLY